MLSVRAAGDFEKRADTFRDYLLSRAGPGALFALPTAPVGRLWARCAYHHSRIVLRERVPGAIMKTHLLGIALITGAASLAMGADCDAIARLALPSTRITASSPASHPSRIDRPGPNPVCRFRVAVGGLPE